MGAMGGMNAMGHGRHEFNGMNAMGMSRGMGGMMGGMGGMGGRNGMNQFGNNNQNSKNQSKMRPSVKVGFAVPPATAATANATSTAIQSRIARLPSTVSARGIQVVMEGRTAILRGNVASQADERMMQRLVSLEPGVSTVRSELSYPGKADASAAPAARPEFVPSAQ